MMPGTEKNRTRSVFEGSVAWTGRRYIRIVVNHDSFLEERLFHALGTGHVRLFRKRWFVRSVVDWTDDGLHFILDSQR